MPTLSQGVWAPPHKDGPAAPGLSWAPACSRSALLLPPPQAAVGASDAARGGAYAALPGAEARARAHACAVSAMLESASAPGWGATGVPASRLAPPPQLRLESALPEAAALAAGDAAGCDVALMAECGSTYAAHRALLRMRGAFFAAALRPGEGAFAEGTPGGALKLPASAAAVEALRGWAYGGALPAGVPLGAALEAAELARAWLLPELAHAAMAAAAGALRSAGADAVVAAFHWAQERDEEPLMRACVCVAAEQGGGGGGDEDGGGGAQTPPPLPRDEGGSPRETEKGRPIVPRLVLAALCKWGTARAAVEAEKEGALPAMIAWAMRVPWDRAA